jgi:hypothetical protein
MKKFTATGKWISSPLLDGMFILSPPFIILCVIFLFPTFFAEHEDVSPLIWLIVVLGVDVSHVYSTLFRTYFEPTTFKEHQTTLTLIPLISWLTGMMLYSLGSIYFWRTLAYLAVFHFIRQQYGFMRIYAAKESRPKKLKQVDNFLIYAITGIPIIIWHCSPDRNFTWFVKNDFLLHTSRAAIPLLQSILFTIVLAYCIIELLFVLKTKQYNIPKYLLLAGTFVSWYFGIVYFNSDLIFTLFNVITHGIPYMMLIWVYGNKKSGAQKNWYSFLFSAKGIIFYVGILLVIAYVEEGFWDLFIWKEHQSLFAIFSSLSYLDSINFSLILIPLLSVPQISHYIIDGFIWKIKEDRYDWKVHVMDK